MHAAIPMYMTYFISYAPHQGFDLLDCAHGTEMMDNSLSCGSVPSLVWAKDTLVTQAELLRLRSHFVLYMTKPTRLTCAVCILGTLTSTFLSRGAGFSDWLAEVHYHQLFYG